jgi:hypothetical protein
MKTNKRDSFDISKYSIQYQSVFEVKEIQDSFYNHLKTEFNTEPFDCILEINSLKELKSDKEIISKCNEIVDKYLRNTSKKEVNISGDSKLRLFSKLEKQLTGDSWICEESAYDIFFPVKRILFNELHADNFPRYVRTQQCADVVSSFVDNPRVMVLSSILKYPLCDKDFENPFISNIEMEFINEISKDSFVWQSVHSSKVMNLYTSSTPFLPDSDFFKNSKSIKMESVLPFSFEKVATFFFSLENLKKIDSELIDIKINEKHWTKDLKEKFPDEKIKNPFYFVTAETFGRVKHFPFNTPRKTLDIFNIEYDEENQSLSFVRRPYLAQFAGKNVDWEKKMNFETFPTLEGKELTNVQGYLMNVMDMIKIQIIDPYTTRLTYVMSIPISRN